MTWNLLPQNLILKMNEILKDLEAFDQATYDHCVRVGQWARFLANAAGCSEYEKLQAQMAGLLHDVGKMKIPLEILKKPGKLTEKEYQLVKNHSIFSAEVLEPLEHDEFFREIQLAVLHHHERVDGKGYPFNLEGEQIPYISRILLIVDTFDAMTSERTYRKPLSIDVVYKELRQFKGTQFDEDLVEVFISSHKALLEKGKSAPILELRQLSQAA